MTLIERIRNYAIIIVIASFLFALSIGLFELFKSIGMRGLLLYASTAFVWTFSLTMMIELIHRSNEKDKNKKRP